MDNCAEGSEIDTGARKAEEKGGVYDLMYRLTTPGRETA